MAQKTFSAAIDAWALKSRRRLEYIVKESAQRVMQQANEGVPVDTGFAQASFRATLNGYSMELRSIPHGTPKGKNQGGSQSFFPDQDAVALVINGMKVGQDVLYGVWSANYVIHLEYGANGRSGVRFLGKAVQNWQNIVSTVVAEAKSKIGE